ncbi:hypothetical protein [Aequorivita echinoideorum]|uniref:Uncharacterized protein n=1 Tax=Aequorivita echinoideorum TaxID=1549647 RepID=A0ABS5S4T1_9FLAO|nr:hypothetical protein [Aequorivita echinoideorum]MBT0607377.1 hypothetical protein [Aequorivita echinoideorum]
MRNTIITGFTLLIGASLLAQDTQTLEHFDTTSIAPITESYPNTDGYYTGHNAYGDEEFAEKYEIQGSAQVYGVMAIHEGEEGTSALNTSYRIYTVAANGLPGTPVASKNVPYNDVPVDGSMFTVDFTNPASVSGEFFVSFNLNDYVHGNLGTKKIAITHAPPRDTSCIRFWCICT